MYMYVPVKQWLWFPNAPSRTNDDWSSQPAMHTHIYSVQTVLVVH